MEYIEKVKRLRNREEKVLEEIIKDYNQYVSAIVYKILSGYTAEIDIQGVINYVFFYYGRMRTNLIRRSIWI